MKCWFRLNTMQHHANKNKEKLDTRPPIAPKILPNEENKKLTHGARQTNYVETEAPQFLGISAMKPQNAGYQDATMRSSTGGSVPFNNNIGLRKVHTRLHSAKSDQILIRK